MKLKDTSLTLPRRDTKKGKWKVRTGKESKGDRRQRAGRMCGPLLGEAGKWTERGSPDDPWGSLKKGLPAMAIQLVRGLR